MRTPILLSLGAKYDFNMDITFKKLPIEAGILGSAILPRGPRRPYDSEASRLFGAIDLVLRPIRIGYQFRFQSDFTLIR
jgi:hypothetical protein